MYPLGRANVRFIKNTPNANPVSHDVAFRTLILLLQLLSSDQKNETK